MKGNYKHIERPKKPIPARSNFKQLSGHLMATAADYAIKTNH
jgi:hypothetical protein